VFLLSTIIQSSDAVLGGMDELMGRMFPDFSRAILEDLLRLSGTRLGDLYPLCFCCGP